MRVIRPPSMPNAALGLTWMVAATFAHSLGAQQFTGTFSVPTETGGSMTVLLQEAGGGTVTGRLVSDGTAWELEGQIDEGTLIGFLQGAEGVLYFGAERWGDDLWLELYGSDAYGQPNYEEYSEFQLTLVQSPSAGGSPMDVPVGRPARGSPGRGGAGAAPGGVPGGALRRGSGPPAPRPPGLTSTGRPLAPGFTEAHPLVDEWVVFLGGSKLTTMSSYSSGSAGGYTSRTDVYLCSDRTYLVRDENSVSVDVGGAFGSSGGVGANQGSWYVITDGRVVGLILESETGEVSEYRMDYRGQETYANGQRVYVTPAEVCG